MTPDHNPFGSEEPPRDPFGRPLPGGGEDVGAPEPVEGPRPGSAAETWSTGPAPPPDQAPPPARRADGAIAALVLGILGIVLCPLCAPFAWGVGRKAEQLVDASGGTLGGRGEATAGKILGIVGTALLVIGIVLLVVLVALGSSIDTATAAGDGY